MLVGGTTSAALAHNEPCTGSYIGAGTERFLQTGKDRNADRVVCIYPPKRTKGSFWDNHVHENQT
jgi:hypothetical protein